MQLLRIDDPRDPLLKASRYELCELAKAHGISEIGYGKEMTLPEMVDILKKNGVHDIKIPDRPLGVYTPVILNKDAAPPAPVVRQQEPPKPVIDKPVSEMSMNELRSECKNRGIKMDRRDNLNTLREKLS